jgi:hypothetical protein
VDALVDDPIAEAFHRIAWRCGSVIP